MASTFQPTFSPNYSQTEQKPVLTDNTQTSFIAPTTESQVSFLNQSPVFGPALPPTNASSSTFNYMYPQDSTLPWAATDTNGANLYNSVSQDSDFTGGIPYGPRPQTVIDASLLSYGTVDPLMGLQQGDTPPSSTFATQGLPFPALDFIRNYTPGVYEDSQDGLWQGFDGGEFRYDPDLPFSLGELPTEGNS